MQIVAALAAKETSVIAIEKGQFSEAERCLRFAIELNSHDDDAWCRQGNVIADHSDRFEEAEAAYRKAVAISGDPVLPRANLAWLLVALDRLDEADQIVVLLDDLDPVGCDLLQAARALASDNFGEAAEYLQRALEGDQGQLHSTFSDDLLRLLRIAVKRGYGEKLIAWFNQSGQAERQAPVYAAFVAFVRGERFLLDFSPEVRKPAEKMFRWLNSRADRSPATPDKPARKRGRPRKRQIA
ncbi:hypothetical protein DNX69_02175 [Rhodopseudomonas palustris]|uniref:Uncharacterized protein n=2 Tax=Rhodopseudomonas palustris TaxID=1076 RepID=A0A323V0G1_RHOPL|nr:hypothetical protein DNX69_02175 [Rhodopseudomonas palustris]